MAARTTTDEQTAIAMMSPVVSDELGLGGEEEPRRAVRRAGLEVVLQVHEMEESEEEVVVQSDVDQLPELES